MSRTKEKIRCDACPVMCYIADGKSGACDRYANEDGNLIPHSYDDFNTFMIKIVCFADNPASPPLIKDFRAIAIY